MVPVRSDDDVVEQGDVKGLPPVLELVGQSLVRCTRRRVAAWVVVGADERRAVVQQQPGEHKLGVHDTARTAAGTDLEA